MEKSWLRTYRNKLRITQEELAARLQTRGFEYSAGAISHWEKGRYKPPIHNEEFRNVLASILRITPQEMLSAAGYETEQEHSEAGERAATILDRLPPDKQQLALSILEQFREQT